MWMTKKPKPIKMDREEYKNLRKTYGIDHQFYVADTPYNAYKQLIKISKLKKKGGDKDKWVQLY